MPSYRAFRQIKIRHIFIMQFGGYFVKFYSRQIFRPYGMCFFDFLCMSEVVTPTTSSYDPATRIYFGDVKVDNYENLQFLEVRIKESKTDPFCLFWIPLLAAVVAALMHELAGSVGRYTSIFG